MTKNSLNLILILAAAAGLSGCHGAAWDCGPKKTVVEKIKKPAPKPEAPALCVAEPIQVGFEFDKTDLDAKGKSDMDSLAECLVSNPTQTIKIAGHADLRGSVSYNQGLSEKRANVVKGYILSKGVSESNITEVVGYGETQPIASGKTEADHEQNRRAHVTVFQK